MALRLTDIDSLISRFPGITEFYVSYLDLAGLATAPGLTVHPKGGFSYKSQPASGHNVSVRIVSQPYVSPGQVVLGP